jgi:signal transduction histidine kinase
MGDMGADRLRRLMAARHAPRIGVALLVLAAVGQSTAQAVALGDAGASKDASVLAMLYALPLCTLALAAVLPLVMLRPGAAAIVAVAANVLVLAALTTPTVAAMVAALIAVARLGAADGVQPPGWLGTAAQSAVGAAGAQFLAVALGLPFLVLALAKHGSVAAVLLAALVPLAAGAGIAFRARGVARTHSAAANALADTLLAHSARGERARIARELHDVVAHHITMISVQAETARLTTPGLPEAGARRLAEIGDTARAGLTEMRRLLGVLREDAQEAGAAVVSRQPQPGLGQLADLVDAARDAAGGGVRLIVSGPVAMLDPGVELAAYRIVQEALSNSRRHASGAAVDVELRYGADVLRLRVRDNGPGPVGAGAEGGGPGRAGAGGAGAGGHGLLGMRERALSVGGTLRTGPAAGGGFIVEAVLPANPVTAATAIPATATPATAASSPSASSPSASSAADSLPTESAVGR